MSSALLTEAAAADGESASLARSFSEPADVEPLALERPESLVRADEALWQRVRGTLQRAPRRLDRLLFRAYSLRRAKLDGELREALVRFFAMGYVITRDARYLNELLWFDRAGGQLRRVALRTFRELVDNAGRHVHPLASTEDVRRQAAALASRALDSPAAVTGDGLRVGLVGAPWGFARMHRRLAEAGIPTELIFCSAAEQRRVHRIAARGLTLARGITAPVTRLPHGIESAELGRALAARDLPLAVHHLPYILRRNIIDAFAIGVLNDHLAILPYVRGRSSVEFSLLFGFPVGGTVHLVDEGVDTGPLLVGSVTDLNRIPTPTVRAVKAAVARDHEERILRAVRFVAAGGRALENPPTAGLQYFSMHDALIDHVERAILPATTAAALPR